MDLKKKVFTKLKAEAQAYGYKRDELMSVAAHIADNLKLADDASEEDVDDAVDTAVSASIPFLKFGQSMATRIVNDAKLKKDQTKDDDDGDVDDDNEPEPTAPKKSKKTSSTDDSATPAWAAAMMKTVEALTAQVETMKGEKVATSRKERLSTLLKDTGTFGDMTLKHFDLMSFKDDDAFEDYLSGVEDELAKFKQQLADNGLLHLGNPPAPKLDKPKGEDKVFTDDDIQKIADGF